MSQGQGPEGPTAQVRNVLHPVSDVAAAVAFYGAAFGLPTKFVDGERYAALDAGGVSLALAGPEEDVTGGIAAASFKVADLPASLDALREAGGVVVTEPVDGPHETRAVVRDPWGNTLIVYAAR